MKILAIEISSAVGSVALLQEDVAIVHREIPVSNGRTSALFGVLEDARAQAGWSWAEVDLFAAGRGPGRYSGMRVALTAVQGLALPGGNAVRAVSSGAALAAALAEDHQEFSHFAVLGDARRDRVWLGVFRRGEGGVQMIGDWRLAAYDELGEAMPGGALAASSEWSRLQPRLAATDLLDRAWIQRDVYPAAEWVGRLARAEYRANTEPAPLVPIYLHPPVNVA